MSYDEWKLSGPSTELEDKAFDEVSDLADQELINESHAIGLDIEDEISAIREKLWCALVAERLRK